MIVYYLYKAGGRLADCPFPIKEGDICMLYDGEFVKTIYIDNAVDGDSIWRDYRYIDSKSLRSYHFPQNDIVLCVPYEDGYSDGDQRLLLQLIKECTGEWLLDFLNDTNAILSGMHNYWDLNILRRLTGDESIKEHLEHRLESKIQEQESKTETSVVSRQIADFALSVISSLENRIDEQKFAIITSLLKGETVEAQAKTHGISEQQISDLFKEGISECESKICENEVRLNDLMEQNSTLMILLQNSKDEVERLKANLRHALTVWNGTRTATNENESLQQGESSLEKNGLPWSQTDKDDAVRYYKAGVSIRSIATALKRSEAAVQGMLNRLGYPVNRNHDVHTQEKKDNSGSQQGSSLNSQVSGIWTAFLNTHLHNIYVDQLIKAGERSTIVASRMQHFRYKIKAADIHPSYGKRLKKCQSFEECRKILIELIKSWGNESRFSWRREFFMDYLAFLQKRFIKYGTLEYKSKSLSQANTEKSSQQERPKIQLERSSERKAVEPVNTIEGIWAAFLNTRLQKEYRDQLIKSGESKSAITSQLAVFKSIVEAANTDATFGTQLNGCKTFEECKIILVKLIETWGGASQWFAKRKQFFLGYVDFLQERFNKYGTFDIKEKISIEEIKKEKPLNSFNTFYAKKRTSKKKESKESTTTHGWRVELTYRNGEKKVMMPNDAFMTVVNAVGPEAVNGMRLMSGGTYLIHFGKPDDSYFYVPVNNGYWLRLYGPVKARFELIERIVSKYSFPITSAKLV